MKFVVFVFSILSAQVYAGDLKRVALPSLVKKAREANYKLGREFGDSGGISGLYQFVSKPGLSNFQILNSVMKLNLGGISKRVCAEAKTLLKDCTQLVIDRNELVISDGQFVSIPSFIEHMKTWMPGDERWEKSLFVIEEYFKRFVRNGFNEFAFGYADVADVFQIILISQDRSRVVVLTGDFGS